MAGSAKLRKMVAKTGEMESVGFEPGLWDLNPDHLHNVCVGPSISFITTDLVAFNFAAY